MFMRLTLPQGGMCNSNVKNKDVYTDINKSHHPNYQPLTVTIQYIQTKYIFLFQYVVKVSNGRRSQVANEGI